MYSERLQKGAKFRRVMHMNIKDKKLFLLDMDGTLYLGNRLFDKVTDFLALVKERGGRYMFLTNNSSKSAQAYVEKFGKLGIKAEEKDFFSSTEATILYLIKNGYKDKRIYAFGTASFKKQLADAGLDITDKYEKGIDVLLCGFDTELTFKKLDDASRLLFNGVEFIATHPDWVCPTEYGCVPDCGSVCQMLTIATGKTPMVIGKPRPEMVYAAMEACGALPDETVMIGDRIYTDIACGVNAGIDTILVLSGETTAEEAEKSDIKPTVITESIGVIYDKYLRKETLSNEA